MAASPDNLTEKLDSLYTSTWQDMRGEVADQIYGATPLTYWLMSKGRIKTMEGTRWIGLPLMYSKNATVASLGPGGTVDITPTDSYTTAKFDWKYIAGSIIRLFDEDTNNRGKSQIFNLIEAKAAQLRLSLVDKFETMLFGDGSGNGSLDFLGLQAIVQTAPTANPASGAVGGIDTAAGVNTWWRNQTRTWSVTGLPSGDIDIAFNFRKTYNLASVGNDHPTLCITEAAQYERYEASITTILKPVDTNMNDLGFEAMRYKGAALTFSPSAPAAQAYFLNERYLELVVDSAANFHMTGWKEIPNQLDRVAQVIVKGNLVCSNRRMQAVLHTIT